MVQYAVFQQYTGDGVFVPVIPGLSLSSLVHGRSVPAE